MSDDPAATVAEHFSELEDPRSDSGKRYLLLDIIVIAICATICGADDWVAVELFGQAKEEWLRTFLKLPHGIPYADYLLALRENQGNLYSKVAGLFDYAEEIGFRDVEYDWDQMTNKGHGRIQVRQCWTIRDPDFMSYARQFGDWPEFNTIVKVHAERSIGTEVPRKTRHYLTSLGNDAQQALYAARGHWRLHALPACSTIAPEAWSCRIPFVLRCVPGSR